MPYQIVARVSLPPEQGVRHYVTATAQFKSLGAATVILNALQGFIGDPLTTQYLWYRYGFNPAQVESVLMYSNEVEYVPNVPALELSYNSA